MVKVIISLGITLICTNLFALDLGVGPESIFTDSSNDSKTRYAKLEELFDSAQSNAATMNDLMGWHAGRCYAELAPETPAASMLVGDVIIPTENHGPLFPAENSRKFVLVAPDQEVSEDFFDHMTEEEEDNIQASIEENRLLWDTNDPIEENGSLVTEYHPTIVPEHLPEEYHRTRVYAVKKSGRYLVVALQRLEDYEERGTSNANMYCYHFKKVR